MLKSTVRKRAVARAAGASTWSPPWGRTTSAEGKGSRHAEKVTIGLCYVKIP